MQAVTFTPLCLSCVRDLIPFSPSFLFFSSLSVCFFPLRFFPRFLPPPSCFLLLDFFLQEFLPFSHFLLLSAFPFLLSLLRPGTASLCTSWCLSPSTLASIFDETISLLPTPWEVADADTISERIPMRRGRKKDGEQSCSLMLPGK